MRIFFDIHMHIGLIHRSVSTINLSTHTYRPCLVDSFNAIKFLFAFHILLVHRLQLLLVCNNICWFFFYHLSVAGIHTAIWLCGHRNLIAAYCVISSWHLVDVNVSLVCIFIFFIFFCLYVFPSSPFLFGCYFLLGLNDKYTKYININKALNMQLINIRKAFNILLFSLYYIYCERVCCFWYA